MPRFIFATRLLGLILLLIAGSIFTNCFIVTAGANDDQAALNNKAIQGSRALFSTDFIPIVSERDSRGLRGAEGF